jgi:hypothetical protein
MSEVKTSPDKLSVYLAEYRKQLGRLEHIKEMLDHLNEESVGLARDIRIKSNQMGAVVASTFEKELPKQESKRGRKSKWGSFIMHRLKKEKRPLSYDEVIDDIVRVFGIEDASQRESTRKVIFSTCHRLKSKEELINTFRVKGNRGKYIALKKWCTPGGKLKKEFALKITDDHRKIIA